MLGGACPERHEILRYLRMTRSEGFTMTPKIQIFEINYEMAEKREIKISSGAKGNRPPGNSDSSGNPGGYRSKLTDGS
ncbi:unnamed protein product [marine sediment metagenome]|uniref:Uncharacterized protein n=1 Tax=marine sediment metagenome TaxID=412755 RepID=X1UBU7_9ZZZZ